MGKQTSTCEVFVIHVECSKGVLVEISSFVLCVLELSVEGCNLNNRDFSQASAGEVISRVSILMQEFVNARDF